MASFTFTGSAVAAGTVSKYSPANLYSDLVRVRSYLALASQNTDDDTAIKRFIYSSSRAIDRETKRFFYPERKTRYYDHPDNTGLLKFDEDLLEVKGLSAINGASEIDSSVYWPKRGGEWGETPYDRIELSNDSGSLFNFSGTTQRSVHLDGIWGFREHYDDDGWTNTGASTTASFAAGDATISLSGSAGENSVGYYPRIWEDQILKVDDEMMRVVAGNSPSQLRVIRGINGTTAASHAASATVHSWEVEPEIEYSCRVLTVYQYIKSIDPTTERVAVPTLGGFSISAPSTWPPDVTEALRYYKKRRVYSFSVED